MGVLGGVLGAMVMVNHFWSLSQSQFMVMLSHSQIMNSVKSIFEQGQSLAEWVVMAGR